MAAGDSIGETAQRAREKAERLQRYAESCEQGAVGERLTGSALDGLSTEWRVFHDVRWPGRPRANIDHVVVGPGGVFVVDSKNWSGSVTLKDGVLRQNGYRRDAVVEGATAAARSIADLVGDHAIHVRPVLCFAQQPALRGVAAEVAICSTDSIVDLLSSRLRVMTDAAATAVADALSRYWGKPSRRAAPATRPVADVRSVIVGLLVAVLLITVGPGLLLAVASLLSSLITNAVAR